MNPWPKYLIIILLALCLTGCASIGPETVTRDRFDYTEAISDSWKHQMLLNMIKIRYGDTPVFMDVSSVISQYQISGLVNLGATFNNHPWSSSQALGATGQYVDRPTITYSPILGDRFARSLMSPIPPASILSLMQGPGRIRSSRPDHGGELGGRELNRSSGGPGPGSLLQEGLRFQFSPALRANALAWISRPNGFLFSNLLPT
jgi:hypothetical protein